MTIQLVQQSHIKTQLDHECLSEVNPKNEIKNRTSREDDDYLKLYESSEPKPQQRSPKNLFYLFILTSIKLLIKFYFFVNIHFTYFYYLCVLAYEKVRQSDTTQLKVYTEQFKSMGLQIPKHVCVILNQDLDDDKKIIEIFTQIIESLYAYGVENITFYRFNQISSKVKDSISSKFLGKDVNNNEDKTNKSNDLRNRHVQNERATNKLNLKFLSIEQGGNSILVNACKIIATKVLNNQIDLNDVNQDLVNLQVIEYSDMIEPQMVIAIGNEDTVSGFSSWHLRLSEIIKIPSYKLVNRITIRNAIIKYNKIEKRFGK